MLPVKFPSKSGFVAWRWLALVGILASLAAVAMGSKKGCQPVEPTEPVCVDAEKDCKGLTPPVDCEGAWTCSKTATCTWVCDSNPGPLGECMSDWECPKGYSCTSPDECLACASCPACAVCCGHCVKPPVEECFVGGCSGQLCSSIPGLASTCEWLPWYECYQFSQCGAYAEGGGCGWEQSSKFVQCMKAKGAPGYEDPAPVAKCYVGGCSGQLCSSQQGLISTCEFLPWYTCFQYSNCGPHGPNGACAWDKTAAFEQCMGDNGGSVLK